MASTLSLGYPLKRSLVGALVIIVSVMSLISAYGFFVTPPPTQQFLGAGFVYTAEFECGIPPGSVGFALVPGGIYHTFILVHNNREFSQKVWVKVVTTVALIFSPLSFWANDNGYTLQADAVLTIDCQEIFQHYGRVPDKSFPGFIMGHVVISHPTTQTTPLDVSASYLSGDHNDSLVSKTVILIPGVSVPQVPVPPACVSSASGSTTSSTGPISGCTPTP